MKEFTHLHVHSHYSLLNALPKIPELVQAAKADGQSALALTDDGNLYGAIEFYKEATKEGIKPIIGVDFYVAPRNRHQKEFKIDNHTSRLVLLAKNKEGYQNLVKLSTLGFLEGFYFRPRVDLEILEKYNSDVFAILPSFSGEHIQHIKNNDLEKAKETILKYKQIYKDNLFLEITHHPELIGHQQIQEKIKELSRQTKVPLVAAHDVYYIKKEHNLARELVRAIGRGTQLLGDEAERPDDFSFISQKQANEYFKDIPEALENTKLIADQCNLELTLGQWILPAFPKPNDVTYDQMLKEEAYKGAKRRGVELTPEAKKRLEYELDVIKTKGYSAYFLIVADLMRYARENGIYTNTRGSAAGSFVSYLVGITTVNPLDYNLPFERFLNPERPSAPDIDMDIADNKRDELIEYARRKYGKDHVAQIGTFGTMAARAAVRDVARALGYSYSVGDRIAKLIPFGAQGFGMTIDKALEIEPELKEAYERDPETREILDLAKMIEGNARHVGVHAAGVVIAPKPVVEYAPLQFDPKGEGKVITQYDMYSIADEYGGVGLLKFDFLGLKNLSILADSIQRVYKNHGVKINVDKIPLDDKKTFQMLSSGLTVGVFQLSSAGMTKWLMELKPTTVHDINAMVALYRPGPMEFIPDYIERKRDPSKVTYLDPRLEKILKNTFGILIYQDDVMLIAVELAGYSWGEADKFRKAMGKKIPEEMARQKDKFLQGCIDRGMKPEVAKQLWEQIETFAAYGFNKCVTKDTLITLANKKRVPITKIKAGDKVLTYNKQENKLIPAKVKDIIKPGKKEIIKIETITGKTIKTTPNHPYLKAIPAKSKKRVGIFIDAANFEQSMHSIKAVLKDHKSIIDAFENDFYKVEFVRYYTPVFNFKKQKPFFAALSARKFKLVTKQVKTIKTNSKKIRKANFDVEISVDAMYLKDRFDVMVLFSGDSDFAYMAKKLQSLGKQVIVISTWNRTAKELRNQADLFLNLKDIIEKAPLKGSVRGGQSMPVLKILPNMLAPVNSAWELAEELKEKDYIATYQNNKLIFEKISSIEKLEPEEVFDLEIENTHNFIANNILAHNSHSVSYGNLAYKTAYMKANYPLEFMSALLTADAGDTEKIAEIIEECEKMKIKILPPDINESNKEFSEIQDQHAIRFGLMSIKNFGEKIAEAIVQEREKNGPYKSLADFLTRVDDKNLNKRALEALIKAGAMDRFGSRASMLAGLDNMLEFHKQAHSTGKMQQSLFGSFAQQELHLPQTKEVSLLQKLAWEKELLGLYISGHPLDAFKHLEGKPSIAQIKQKTKPGTTVVIAGVIEAVKTILTKKNEKMAFVKISDKTSEEEVLVFPSAYKNISSLLEEGKVVLFKGQFNTKDDEKTFVVEQAKELKLPENQ